MRSDRFLLAVALTLATTSPASARDLVEGIVIRVNERIITTEGMRDRIREKEAEAGVEVPPQMYGMLVREAADELVLLERAVELKLTVDAKEVDAALAQLKENNNITEDAAFETMLQQAGLSLAKLRERLRETILINRVLTVEVGTFEITEEELRQRYAREQDRYLLPERVHLEHVVFSVAPDGSDREAVRDRARRLVAAVRSGGEFLELIDQEATAGGASGGDLGIIAFGDLRSEVADAVRGLAEKEISDPFTSPAGVHVARLTEFLAATPKSFAEVKDQLRQSEMSDRYRSKLGGVVDELKKRYIVEIRPELFGVTEVPASGT